MLPEPQVVEQSGGEGKDAARKGRQKRSEAKTKDGTPKRGQKKAGKHTAEGNGRSALPGENGQPQAAGENASNLPFSGKTLDAFTERKVEWFLKPYLPNGMLSLVIGKPNAGKSCFLAWLIAQCRRCLYLTGNEELFEAMTLPRLRAHGVRNDQVVIIDARKCQLPQDADNLILAAKQCGADLIACDNLHSHLATLDGLNDEQAIRHALEEFCRVAHAANVAVVACRHPGKDSENLNPNSREFHAVPRSIVLLEHDPGPPDVRYISLIKDPCRQGPSRREVKLEGEKGVPPVFRLGEEDLSRVGLVRPMDSDHVKRTKIVQAMEMIRGLLADGRKEGFWLYRQCRQEGIGEDTVLNALHRLGCKKEGEGQGRDYKTWWSLPDS